MEEKPIPVADDDQFGRIDMSALYPPFQDKLLPLLEACAARGARYYAICGERTWEEQDALYAKGRTTGVSGHIVTKARGGQSPHNFCVAVDFCHDADLSKPGLQPDWRDESNRILAEEAAKLGLEAGFYWKFQDTPHVQLPVKARGLTWVMLADAYRVGGKAAVFALLDEKGPW